MSLSQLGCRLDVGSDIGLRTAVPMLSDLSDHGGFSTSWQLVCPILVVLRRARPVFDVICHMAIHIGDS
jgi:hypothetical protein